MLEPVSDEYQPARVFIAADESVHLSKVYPWGEGRTCQEGFTLGSPYDGLVTNLTCPDCQALLPQRWNVVLPDKRFSEDYRVVHSEVEDQAVAEQLATDLSAEAYVVEVA